MKIILLRHGKPELDLTDHKNDLVTAHDIKRIVDDYRWIGLAKIQSIPEAVKQFSSQCAICVTSDMARAIESAHLMVGDNIFKSDSIYREAELPYPSWSWLKMPLKIWFYLLRIMWKLGYKQNAESFSSAVENANIGAAQLTTLATEHESVLLIGHGINMYLISIELKRLGWSGSNACATDYWDYNHFEKQSVE